MFFLIIPLHLYINKLLFFLNIFYCNTKVLKSYIKLIVVKLPTTNISINLFFPFNTISLIFTVRFHKCFVKE